MKVQPLNKTALVVSWNRPETVYHPPIIHFMISYSWNKNDEPNDQTFTKDNDQDLVRIAKNASNAATKRSLDTVDRFHPICYTLTG